MNVVSLVPAESPSAEGNDVMMVTNYFAGKAQFTPAHASH
jgi:hypothetical protein